MREARPDHKDDVVRRKTVFEPAKKLEKYIVVLLTYMIKKD